MMHKDFADLIKLFNEQRFEEGYELGTLLYKKNKHDFVFLKILGVISFKINKIDESIKCFEKSIKLNNNDSETFRNLGVAYLNKPNYQKAIKAFNFSTDLNNGEANTFNYLGVAYSGLKNFILSEKNFKKAIQLNNNYLEALNNIGTLYIKNDLYPESEYYFEKAAKIEKSLNNNSISLAISKRMLGKHEEALNLFKDILDKKIEPEVCYYNIGKINQELKNYGNAIKNYKKAANIKPDFIEAQNEIGFCLLEKKSYKESLIKFKKIIRLYPLSKIAYYNVGALFLRRGKISKALNYFNKALDLDQYFVDANYAKSYCLLVEGKYEEGWKYYRWRSEGKFLSEKYNKQFNKERLTDLKKAKNKIILVVYEQGLGDTIQFSRYIKLLAEISSNVIFQPQHSLIKLLKNLDKRVKIITRINRSIKYDYYCNLLDLPRLYGTNLHNIPKFTPYIFADKEAVRHWRKKLDNKKFNIGISWQGSKKPIDQGRSFPLDYFKNIAKINKISLLSLQKNDGTEQIKDFKKNNRMLDFSGKLDKNYDFVDTAAIMKNLDLIITSDTSIAHLAGALGCRVWVLLKLYPDWRYLLNTSHSAWYPSMKLYRQKKINEWEGVFLEIKKDLITLLN